MEGSKQVLITAVVLQMLAEAEFSSQFSHRNRGVRIVRELAHDVKQPGFLVPLI